MSHRNIFLTIIVIILLILPASVLAAGKHALLIGIQDYSYNDSLPSLKGPEHDLRITEKVLRERFKFQDDDFIRLKDAEATHTGIEEAFNQLIERVNPGDFVYIYYSGHGSQTEDRNGDERDGLDETWVSYGARKDEEKEDEEKDNFDVLDDEIDAWLAQVYAKTSKVIFVSDSCHSATVSRGQAEIARAVKVDTRLHPLGEVLYDRPDENAGVRIGAARDRESAIEVPIDIPDEKKEEYFGLFTWFWVQALQQAKDGDTWNDVFKRASTQVTAGRGDVQRPQIWGQRGLQLGEEGFVALQPTVPITDVDGDTVTLGAGHLSGVTVGSVYRSDDPANLATLKITRVKTFESEGKAEGTFKKSDLVIEESHAYRFSPIKVYLDADYRDEYDKSLLQTIRSAFQPPLDDEIPAFPGYALTCNPQQADLHLYILRPKLENGQYVLDPDDDVLPKSFSDQPPEVWILTPEHRLLHESLKIRFDDPTKGMRNLRENLNKYARIQELKTLSASRGSTLQIKADAYLLTPVKSCQEGPDCKYLSDDLGFYRVTGPHSLQEIEECPFTKNEILTFTLHNTSDRHYYYYLINIAPDGTVKAIFPSPEEEPDCALIRAGEKRELINDVGLMMAPGEETIKFIASRQSFDVSLLEMKGFEMRGGPKGEYNPLEQLLVNALHEQRGKTVNLRNDEWATDQVSFEVRIEP